MSGRGGCPLRRQAVLSHFHEVSFFVRHGALPPLPYPIIHLGHAHVIPVPNAELIPGLPAALKKWIAAGGYGTRPLPPRSDVPMLDDADESERDEHGVKGEREALPDAEREPARQSVRKKVVRRAP